MRTSDTFESIQAERDEIAPFLVDGTPDTIRNFYKFREQDLDLREKCLVDEAARERQSALLRAAACALAFAVGVLYLARC